MVYPNCSAQYITQTEYASSRKAGNSNGDQGPTSFHDGQIIIVAKFEGLSSEFTLDGLYDRVVSIATSFGQLIGIMELDVDAGNRQYRAEYCKITDALRVIETVTEDHPANFGVSSTPYVSLCALLLTACTEMDHRRQRAAGLHNPSCT